MLTVYMITQLRNIGRLPFDIGWVQASFPNHLHLTDKVRQLVDSGQIIRLKKGMYILSEELTQQPIERYLVANHLYGPSYVSLHTALRHYGLIPEAVYSVQSVTTKAARSFDTPIGSFFYTHAQPQWFPIGVSIQDQTDLSYLIATPEKALMDVAQFTAGISMRYLKEVGEWLDENLRFDMDYLSELNIDILKQLAPISHKQKTLETIIRFIEDERRV